MATEEHLRGQLEESRREVKRLTHELNKMREASEEVEGLRKELKDVKMSLNENLEERRRLNHELEKSREECTALALLVEQMRQENKKLDVENDDSTDTGASVEQLYKQVVIDHFQKFIKNTNLETISPYLFQNKLITGNDYEIISNHPHKGNYFYIQILPSKGTRAYTMLRRCIAEETDHRGHVDLNQLFKEAEQRVGIRTSFDQ